MLSCNEHNQSDDHIEKENPLMNRFKESTNPGDSNYQAAFKSNYQRYLDDKQYDSCGKLLVSVGNALYANAMSDTTFLNYSMVYFQQYDLPQNKAIRAALANMVASNYVVAGNIDSAKHWFRKGMNNGTEKSLQKSNAFACSEMGILYMANSTFDSAEYYFLKAIHSFEKIKDTQNLIVNYTAISTVFQGLHEWNMAAQYMDRSSILANNSKDTDLIISILQMKAYIKNTGLQDTAGFIALVDSSNALYQQYRNPSLYLQFVQNTLLFDQALSKQESAEAGRYLSKCDSLNTIMRNDGITLQIKYMNCLLTSSVQQILPNQQEVLQLAQELETQLQYVMPANLYGALHKSAVLKQDYKSAWYYTTEQNRCKDLIYNQNKNGQLLEFEKKYQTEKKEKQLAEQKFQLSKNKFQISVLLFSLIGLILTTLLFFVYKKRKEARAEIKRQEEFTFHLFQNTEEERKRIATDLHDGVNHELLTLKNQVNEGKPIHSIDIEKVIDVVRQVSRDLYPAMFDNIGLQASIETLCERLTEAGLFTTSEINYTHKLPKRSELQLYRMIQEALNNTLKHAKANAAKVTIDSKENELWVEIKDNGIGFDADEKITSSTSFGLQSFIQRARAIGGETNIESNNQGTKLIFTTPIR
jgi:hypothetical protein